MEYDHMMSTLLDGGEPPYKPSPMPSLELTEHDVQRFLAAAQPSRGTIIGFAVIYFAAICAAGLLAALAL